MPASKDGVDAPYIALEGLDGSGTTTQVSALAEALAAAGVPCRKTFEPSDGPIGTLVRRVLRGEVSDVAADTLALLYAADRLEHRDRVVARCIDEQHALISDRSVYSSLAYQSTEAPEVWVGAINSHAREPDLVIYLRVSPETAVSRISKRGEGAERFDALATQRRVCARYDAMFGDAVGAGTFVPDGDNAGWRRARQASPGPRDTPLEVAVVDGERSPDEVSRALLSLYTVFVAERGAVRYLPAHARDDAPTPLGQD